MWGGGLAGTALFLAEAALTVFMVSCIVYGFVVKSGQASSGGFYRHHRGP